MIQVFITMKRNPPRWVEIEPEHYVLANDREIEIYLKRLEKYRRG